MSKPFDIPVWKKAPFIRLLLAFAAGIIIEWYLGFTLFMIIGSIASFAIAFLLFSFLPVAVKFKLHFLQGAILQLLLVFFGMLVTWQKDPRHNDNWYGHYYHDSDYIVVTISEPLIEKSKSYKADAIVEQIIHNDTAVDCEGKLLLYFSKDSVPVTLHYGDKILINKKLQAIKNSGNPGAFNYQRYAAFQQIFHNAFLKPSDWVKLNGENINQFKRFIYTARENILAVLQKNVSSNKDELGIAEALLIGYTNDLDKDLVQAYSNTGVVHIIAISGMHLGLIYVMLVWLFAKIPLINKSKLVQVILILSCLWLFSLLTGAAASVVRSAVMFTCVTIGRNYFRASSIYNSLAASAFVMLCFNPYYLWDVGFQLSYLAVVGIIIFQKPIYNLVYIRNKYVNEIWKLVAISMAAQLLAFPICIYYFHQFPNLFLLSNIIAVPLSSFILYAEIALIAFAWAPVANIYLGKTVNWLVWLMNKYILWVNKISFSVWDKIPANVLTTWLLYAAIVFTAAWLLNKNKKMLRYSLLFLLGFILIHGIISWKVKSQQKLIVYNVPQHQAIDFINGNNYHFVGDSVLLEDGLLQNFHLKPSRIALQLNKRTDSLPGLFKNTKFYQFYGKKVLIIDEAVSIEPPAHKIVVDAIIFTHNPRLYIKNLAEVFDCRQFVFDASNSLWKIGKWKEECDQLNLRHHSIPEKGAFVMDIE